MIATQIVINFAVNAKQLEKQIKTVREEMKRLYQQMTQKPKLFGTYLNIGEI